MYMDSEKHELTQFLIDFNMNILLVQETFLKSAQNFRIPNYNITRDNRSTNEDGSAIILKSCIKYAVPPLPSNQLSCIE